MERGEDNDEEKYLTRSSGSDHEEICHLTHGAMYSKHGEDSGEDKDNVEDDEEYEGWCFMAVTSRSSIKKKVLNLLITFNIPSNSYDSLLYDINYSCTYLNDLLISLSGDAEKVRKKLYDITNKVEEKNTKIENFFTKLSNVSIDRDAVRNDNIFLVKHINIYCNTTKRLYGCIIHLTSLRNEAFTIHNFQKGTY